MRAKQLIESIVESTPNPNDTLYKLGRVAYRHGKTLDDNPYLSIQWKNGWHSAKSDHESGKFHETPADKGY